MPCQPYTSHGFQVNFRTSIGALALYDSVQKRPSERSILNASNGTAASFKQTEIPSRPPYE